MQLEMFTAARTRTPRRRKVVDVKVQKLYAAWANPAWTKTDIARELGISDKRLLVLANRHKLPPRPKAVRWESEASPDEVAGQGHDETLDLSPWVQARIRELNIVGEWTQARRFA
jgi:hypothetical protein